MSGDISKSELIRQLLARGVASHLIAATLGVAQGTVASVKHAWLKPDRARQQAGRRYQRRQRANGVLPLEEYRASRSARSRARASKVRELRALGKSYSQIAAELGLPSRNVVAGILHRAGEDKAGQQSA